MLGCREGECEGEGVGGCCYGMFSGVDVEGLEWGRKC